MTEQDIEGFHRLLSDVYAFYRQDFSTFAARVWTQAMKPFEFEAVSDALSRHLMNPDAGQFMPKPADIVKMLQGSTQDAALVAWSKVDRAVREVGTYRSVVFDDPVIHRVITDMGGWVPLGQKGEDEWPFVRNEFVNRYRGYRMRSETPAYLPTLIGVAEAHNTQHGHASQEPTLIGDSRMAYAVMIGGTNKPPLDVTQLDAKLAAVLLTHVQHAA